MSKKIKVISDFLIQPEAESPSRRQLRVGNLAGDVTLEDLQTLFKPYGEITEVLMDAGKSCAFLKVGSYLAAKKAQRELNGADFKGRQTHIRLAPNASTIRVIHLSPAVSDAMLLRGFVVFGHVERAIVVVDERGEATGEGIVEFVQKHSANAAVEYCSGCSFYVGL